MSVARTYFCNVCQTEHKDVPNGWFVLMTKNDSFHLITWDKAKELHVLDEEGIQHLCGQAHAHKMLDEYLSGKEA